MTRFEALTYIAAILMAGINLGYALSEFLNEMRREITWPPSF